MASWLGTDAHGMDRPRDLRLLLPAVAAWLAALGALALPPWLSWLLAGVLGCAALAALTVTRPALEAPVLAVVAALACAATVAAVTGTHVHRTASSAAVAAVEHDGETTFRAVVSTDPRARAGMPRPGRAAWVVPARTAWVRVEGAERASRAPVVVLASGPGWSELLPGQSFEARGSFLATDADPLTASLVLVRGPPERVEPPGGLQAFAGGVRSGLREASSGLPQPERGLLPALIVGDVSSLPERTAEDFRATGMTHLLTVSGANLAILTGFVLGLVRWARAPAWCAVLGGALMIWVFVLVCRPEPSVVRAAFMGSLGLWALAAGREHAGLRALCVTVVGVLFVAPGLAASYGFALSVLATAGILLLVPGWTRVWSARWPRPVAEALAVAVAAQVAVAPVLVLLSGEVSWVAVPANVLAAPVVAVVTVAGSALTALASVWPGAAAFLAPLPGWGVSWIALVARVGAGVPFGALPWRSDVAGALVLAVVLSVFLVTRGLVRRVLAAGAVAVLVLGLAARCVPGGWPPPGWALVACDVGQGDAFVLSAGRGEAVVFDTGDDPDLVDACLGRLGVRGVALLVLSHDHADHVDGVPGVLRHRRVAVALAPPGFGQGAVGRLLEEEGVRLEEGERGRRYRAGPWLLRVLWPTSGFVGSVNDSSLVVRADGPHMSVLFTGDVEEQGQEALLREPEPELLSVTVLTTPHHGANTQSTAFLTATGATVAVTSAGRGNAYGHPTPFTVGVLEGVVRAHARTDLDGDVAVLGDPVRVAVRGPGPDP
ncbi:ComEC/Rec2 family competence protein [Nocardiopsis sp. NPDC007018]|uniref:ComEC/Rec2 family competence protein n=1 Tax=Nocardiopsis sp. NPDC007018 TaxID=3155721 RepID=UPI0033D87E8D